MNSANKITIIRILMIPFIVVCMQQYPAWLTDTISFFGYINDFGIYYAAILFVLTATTDKLDGYIARKYNMVTNLGKLLDPLADKLLVSATLIMLVYLHMLPGWIAFIIIARELLVSSIRIAASAKGIVLAADKFGKIKMVFQVISILVVMLYNFPFMHVAQIPIDRGIMLIAVVLTVYSGYNYIKMNYSKLQLN